MDLRDEFAEDSGQCKRCHRPTPARVPAASSGLCIECASIANQPTPPPIIVQRSLDQEMKLRTEITRMWAIGIAAIILASIYCLWVFRDPVDEDGPEGSEIEFQGRRSSDSVVHPTIAKLVLLQTSRPVTCPQRLAAVTNTTDVYTVNL